MWESKAMIHNQPIEILCKKYSIAIQIMPKEAWCSVHPLLRDVGIFLMHIMALACPHSLL